MGHPRPQFRAKADLPVGLNPTGPCDEPQEDIVNGGYSPTLDLFFYGTTVAKMYEDWIGGTLLKGKILLRAHYGLRWDNAVWNGNNCSFGDGFMSFYPLTSIDIVGHEIGHGLQELLKDIPARCICLTREVSMRHLQIFWVCPPLFILEVRRQMSNGQ